jgi:hypothetical protein
MAPRSRDHHRTGKRGHAFSHNVRLAAYPRSALPLLLGKWVKKHEMRRTPHSHRTRALAESERAELVRLRGEIKEASPRTRNF